MEDGSEGARVVSGTAIRLTHVEDIVCSDEGIGGRAGERTDLRATLDVELMGLVLDYVWVMREVRGRMSQGFGMSD